MNKQEPETGLPAGRPVFSIVDSHAHLDMPEFDPDREEVLLRAESAGVKAVLCPLDLIKPESLAAGLKLKENHRNVILAAGVHPHQASLFSGSHPAEIKKMGSAATIRAVGEIGLDYYYDFSPPDIQKKVLAAQLAAAREAGLPVILHSRLSGPDIIALVEAEKFANGGILHCFTEDRPTAERMLDLGFYVSFAGILTYPKAENVREVARYVPCDRILVETDSPYLVPGPLRNRWKRNEPAFVVETAARLAEIRKTSYEALAAAVMANYGRLFPV